MAAKCFTVMRLKRQQMGITQIKFARMLRERGFTKSQADISNIENLAIEPSPELLQAIADILGVVDCASLLKPIEGI